MKHLDRRLPSACNTACQQPNLRVRDIEVLNTCKWRPDRENLGVVAQYGSTFMSRTHRPAAASCALYGNS